MTDLPAQARVVIVGAGPAGLSAAITLRGLGITDLIVLERDATAGGIPRHCGHYPYGLREWGRLMTGPAYAARLVAQARAAGVRIATGVSVTGLHPGPAVCVTSAAGVGRIAADLVLLTTGIRESSRAERFIGGTKPAGVLSTGALQGLVYLAGQRPFRRPVILGTELVGFSALLTCRHAGIAPAGMVEPGPRATARWPSALFPALQGVPLWRDTQVVAIEGRDQVEAVLLDGPAGQRRVVADGLIVSGRFRPEATLLAGSHLTRDPGTGGPEVDALGRLSDPAFFAAGNLLRPVETAGRCWAEGRAVARAMARALAGPLPAPGPRIVVEGPLSWVMPQRAGAPDGAALDALQLRVRGPVRGYLSLLVDGVAMAGRPLTALPERRITLPLPMAGGQVTVRLEGSR